MATFDSLSHFCTKRIREWAACNPYFPSAAEYSYYKYSCTPHSHFYAICTSRHESSMIPKALKFATLQKKMAPIPPHT